MSQSINRKAQILLRAHSICLNAGSQLLIIRGHAL